MRSGARVGIFGGTFDPPHVGHLIVGGEVVEEAALDRLLWIPARTPPHKAGSSISSPDVRARMVRAAIEGQSRFGFSGLEMERSGISYTVDTLRSLRAAHPDWELFLVLGTDQLATFGSWREPEAILDLARIVAMDRAGAPAGRAGGRLGSQMMSVAVTRIGISSTQVRRRIALGKSVRHMVTDPVLSIIQDEGLYRSPDGTTTVPSGPPERLDQ